MLLHAYRITGEQESVNEVLTWVRHITLREFKSSEQRMEDVVIIILKSDLEALEEGCRKRGSVGYELCGVAELKLTATANNERTPNKSIQRPE